MSLAEERIEADFTRIFRYLLDDEDAKVRAYAINGLWEEEDPSLVRLLIAALRSDPVAVVREPRLRVWDAFCSCPKPSGFPRWMGMKSTPPSSLRFAILVKTNWSAAAQLNRFPTSATKRCETLLRRRMPTRMLKCGPRQFSPWDAAPTPTGNALLRKNCIRPIRTPVRSGACHRRAGIQGSRPAAHPTRRRP